MILRRLIYFSINLILATAILLLIEIILAVLVAGFHEYIPPVRALTSRYRTGSLTALIIFPLIVALLDSSIIGNANIGAYLTRTRMSCPQPKLLSFVGTYLRAIVFWYPPLIYLTIASHYAAPTHFGVPTKSSFLELIRGPLIPDAVFLAATFFLPFTIVFGKGYQGLHDYIFRIAFLRKSGSYSPTFKSKRNILISLGASTICSLIIVVLSENSTFLREVKYLMTKTVAGMTDIRKLEEDSILYEKENEKLQDFIRSKMASSQSGKYFKGLSTSFRRAIIDGTEIIYLHIDFTVSLRGFAKESREELLKDVYMAAKEFCIRNNIRPHGLFLTAALRYVFDLIAFEETDESIFEIRPDAVVQVDRLRRTAFAPESGLFPTKLYYLKGD